VDRAIDDGRALPSSFDLVFVARSSAWTPPWLDAQFEALLAAAPIARRVCLDGTWRTRSLDSEWLEHLQQLTLTG
jgi:hypothetical protein